MRRTPSEGFEVNPPEVMRWTAPAYDANCYRFVLFSSLVFWLVLRRTKNEKVRCQDSQRSKEFLSRVPNGLSPCSVSSKTGLRVLPQGKKRFYDCTHRNCYGFVANSHQADAATRMGFERHRNDFTGGYVAFAKSQTWYD